MFTEFLGTFPLSFECSNEAHGIVWLDVQHVDIRHATFAACNSGPRSETTWESTGIQWTIKWENAMELYDNARDNLEYIWPHIKLQSS